MVNVYLPYSSFELSAASLDTPRLKKQISDAAQIIKHIERIGSATHAKRIANPVVQMWADFIPALKLYYNCCVAEWISRGFQSPKIIYDVHEDSVLRPWFADCLTVQMAYRANLIRKNPAFYMPRFGIPPPRYTAYSYVWPSQLSSARLAELLDKKDEVLDIRNFAKPFVDVGALRRPLGKPMNLSAVDLLN